MNKLTKKSRWMIYFSLFLSGTLIFSTIFYFIAAKDSSNGNAQKIMLILILIAVLAIVAMLISRLKLRKSTKNLSPEFFEVYEEISDKLSGSTMSTMERKETMNDILDLFMQADKDKRQVSEVIGNSTDDFINSIQSAFGYRSSILFNIITGVQYSVIYLFMVQLLIYMENTSDGFFNQLLDISTIFMLTLLALIGVPFLFHFKRKNKLILMIIVPVILLGLFIAIMETIDKFFLDVPWLYKLAEGQINAFPNIGFVVLWIFIFLVAITLKYLQRRMSVRNL